ncbi:phosphopyruvate hydratase [Sansalvadorimonas verongulae]|uniref:phosphopyruvate hydratase n=1 Tax=Sansalvadorimonas verongulae TaxID=2172824 RepID=UPI0012BB79A3|nr:phosphopyruvate hydratase [Sansalvadorimonas verongulae]MTI11973.1 phosphopyruvate hydratase [Sansalvadorimonas verongulae]
MNLEISQLSAREILDSRGNPTVEVECTLASGVTARASVPSGASTGSREAVELRDSDDSRYGGKGVLNALNNIEEEIAPVLYDIDARDQALIDDTMIALDGTENKSRLGANAILGVSLAVCRAAACATGTPLYRHIGGLTASLLPVPCMNVLNGGTHARWQGADFQEFMIAPYGADSFHQAMRWGSEVYQNLRQVLLKHNHHVGVGDEGGFAPAVKSNREPLELICQAIEASGLKPGEDIGICLDPASSEFCKDGKYDLKTEGRQLTSAEMVDYYADMVSEFPICLLEDGLAEDDWDGWPILNEKLGDDIEVVGDDIFVTNVEYIMRGIEENCANSALIKLNQIGTLSETIDAVQLCRDCGWGAFVSHRSGETVDSFIADMSVGLRTGHLKTGAPCRAERVEKYNQLMRIEEELGSAACYAGMDGFNAMFSGS